MKTVLTKYLIGAALDYAVAMADGHKIYDGGNSKWSPGCWVIDSANKLVGYLDGDHVPMYAPSTDWSQGGPIIEREMLGIMPVSDAWWRAGDVDGANGFGPTPLFAAMRCHIAAKLGESVEIPDKFAPTEGSIA